MKGCAAGNSFSFDWLALREYADAQARDSRLTHLAGDWLHQSRRRPLTLIDLGCGSGNNPCYLAPRLPGPQRWRLVDHDRALLDQAARRCRGLNDSHGAAIGVETQAHDLASLDAGWWEGADLVCASALFDLASRGWMEVFVDACARQRAAALLTLSVDGLWAFIDARGRVLDDAEDRWVNRLFQTHQRRDKGLGIALGSEAPQALREAFGGHGYGVELASSPWILPPGAPATLELAGVLVDGWRDAAIEQAPRSQARLVAWHRQRHAALAAGRLGVRVGHVDLFARPVHGSAPSSDERGGQVEIEEGVVTTGEASGGGAQRLVEGGDGGQVEARTAGADQQRRHQQVQAMHDAGFQEPRHGDPTTFDQDSLVAQGRQPLENGPRLDAERCHRHGHSRHVLAHRPRRKYAVADQVQGRGLGALQDMAVDRHTPAGVEHHAFRLAAANMAHGELRIIGGHGAGADQHRIDQGSQAVQVHTARQAIHVMRVSAQRGDASVQALSQLCDHQGTGIGHQRQQAVEQVAGCGGQWCFGMPAAAPFEEQWNALGDERQRARRGPVMIACLTHTGPDRFEQRGIVRRVGHAASDSKRPPHDAQSARKAQLSTPP